MFFVFSCFYKNEINIIKKTKKLMSQSRENLRTDPILQDPSGRGQGSKNIIRVLAISCSSSLRQQSTKYLRLRQFCSR